MLVTLAALAIHVGFPLAPPRMTAGFRDTLQEFGPRIYSSDPRRSISNQFAAMPSLHFGWALMVAVGFVAIKRNRKSLVFLLHPATTLIAIVATGNHYWLDSAIAALLALVFGVALGGWRMHRNGRIQRRLDASEPMNAPEADALAGWADDDAPRCVTASSSPEGARVCAASGSPSRAPCVRNRSAS